MNMGGVDRKNENVALYRIYIRSKMVVAALPDDGSQWITCRFVVLSVVSTIPDTVLTEPALGDLSADHRALVKEYLQTSATMVWLIRCEFSASLSIVA